MLSNNVMQSLFWIQFSSPTVLVQSQNSDDQEEPGVPAVAVYKTHSTGILNGLEDMKEKAEGSLSGLRKE